MYTFGDVYSGYERIPLSMTGSLLLRGSIAGDR